LQGIIIVVVFKNHTRGVITLVSKMQSVLQLQKLLHILAAWFKHKELTVA